MDFLETMRSPYRAVIKEEWKNLDQKLSDKSKIMFPMTTGNDTAVHLAVYSGGEEPTKAFLAAISGMEGMFWRNNAGNTPLHEAATVGNLAAVKLLVEFNDGDLSVENIKGETPLYRAATCGHLHIVEYFLDDCADFFSRSQRNWSTSKQVPIIHAAILSEKFEVVQKLVDFDKSLLEMKDSEGKTALHVLANMPFAFRSGSSMKFFESIIYTLLPTKDIYKYGFSNFGSFGNADSESSEMKNKNEDLEAGRNPNRRLNFRLSNCWLYFQHCFTCLFWRFILLGWPQWKEMYKKKREHKLAVSITEMLAEIDYSWCQNEQAPENTDVDHTGLGHRREGKDLESFQNQPGRQTEQTPENTDVDHTGLGHRGEGEDLRSLQNQPKYDNNKAADSKDIKYDDHHETPLLLAAANGIIEVVEKIFEAHPQAVDYVTRHQRNVLHVAIAHRQREIFDWIQNQRMIVARLVTRIDASGFTALHHVGIIKFYHRSTHGPALQLQEELKWFELVQKEIPALYNMHHSKISGTAREFFEETHTNMLNDGKEWLKNTSQSCSAVAVLISTVVFAAAYTVPGGLNSKTGSPVLLTEPIYMVFTVMDIVALAMSLTSVVLFLSILTSSFKMDDFLHTLPLKLSIGFQLLFFSVASTMMAFALTIVLTVKSEEMKWTVSLLYMATFFPVTMFIIIQLPLYVELLKNIWSYRHNILKFLPMGFVTIFWKVPSKIFIRKFA